MKQRAEALLYCFMWGVYLVFSLLQGFITCWQNWVSLGIILGMYLILGLLLTLPKRDMRLGTGGKIVLFAALILLDQGSKLLVHFFAEEKVLPIVGDMLEIRVAHNTHNSAALNFLNIHLPLWLIVFVKILVLVGIVLLCRAWSLKYGSDRDSFLFLLLLGAGTFCSILDSALWGYSLDFICIPGFCVIDLKDIFINLGCGSLLIYACHHGMFARNSSHSTPV